MIVTGFGAIARHARTPLYRDAYALILSNGISSFVGIAYWALAARLFAPDELGRASLLISELLFLSALTQFNTRVALLRFVPEAGRATARFVLAGYGAAAVGGIVIGTGALVLQQVWLRDSLPLEYLGSLAGAWFVGSIVVWSFFNLQDGLLTGLGKASLVPIENGIYVVAKLALLILLGASAAEYAILVSWTLPALLLVLIVSVFLAKRLIPQHIARTHDRSLTLRGRGLAQFLALDYAASLFATMTTTLLPVLVIAISGASNGAFFYIPWLIVTSLSLIPLYLAASMTVHVAGDRATMSDQVRATLRHVIRLVGPLSIAVFLLAPYGLLVFGKQYAEEGATLLAIAALGLLPYGINVLFVAVARLQGRGRAIVAVQASIAVTTLGLSAVFLAPFGITGVGLAWLIANVVVAVRTWAVEIRPMLVNVAASVVD